MDLATIILSERSKSHTRYIADEVIRDDAEAFGKLWQLIKEGEPPLPRRSVWIMELCVVNYPDLATPYIEEYVEHLELARHNAVQRHLTKILARRKLPQTQHGKLFDLSIKWLLSPQIHVAVKAHSMDIACQIAKGNADLENELLLVIRDQMEFNTAGFKARARKIFRQLESPEQ